MCNLWLPLDIGFKIVTELTEVMGQELGFAQEEEIPFLAVF